MDQIKAMSAHNPGLGCALSNMEITKEQLVGLQSVTHFKCNMCNQSFAINSCANHQEMTVSHAAVTGSILIGCGRTNLNELLTSMDLPTLNGRLYNKCHNDVSDWWATAAEHSMKEAAKEEAQIAAECGDTINGIPAITVVADACWSKRSYRTNYSAASGAAAIIGYKTGKVLHMAVKNKYCTICARSVAKNQSPPTHQCNRNHTGSSTSMEQNDYGESCQKPDMTPEQYETAKDLFLQNLKDLVEKRHEVERDTILQAESTLWLELRRSLLTASSFSKVCKRRPNTNSAPLVKSLVYSYSLGNVAAVKYGKTNETVAIKQLEKQEGVNVQKCGLFIDSEHFFLGASPDGLFEEGIVEIKCPYSARNTDPRPRTGHHRQKN
ncbi:hypothetical protein MSG28_008431 [Choristoneura fumiferana]|nr:hypothetical protein MSG28_008431 [Choristoneura fumiferana]